MRPIDADAALKALRKCQTYLYDARDPELKIELSSAEAAINNLPTIQPGKTQLSRESTTSDLISRTATIDAVNNAFDRETLLTGLVRSIAVSAIRDMPSAQPEPQEGHWIDKGWDGDWAWQIDGRGNCWRLIECSECGKRVLAESNYCPNCGAKMTISTK